jgi:hypothetical protein
VPADVTSSATVLHSFSGTAGGDDIEVATLGDVSGNTLTIEEPGVYYSSGSWKINKTVVLAGDAETQGVTFVAEGSIDIGSAENLTAYWGRDGGSSGNTDLGPGLLLFAWGDGPPSACNANDIKISGSSVTWEGVMYAPHGEAQASASDNSSVDGSIIAHRVNLSGSGMAVNYQTDPDFDPQFQLDLLGTD